ncbi:MAG: NAD(P)-dependent oxidoreductase [Clostridiales Family XIII bacterium]|jgi:3-hydroxyisobutyrate dehydrogenase/glyoxylate/succinic semialdehyde reductase|nr:NAD(P)-dependent oxidoreductase [Clostridiales Family XIII bacterium]
MSKIGWIGVGLMGSRMAPRIMEAGHELCVCDAVRANCDGVVAKGAVLLDSPAELAARSDYVFSMIPNAAALLDVGAGEKGVAAAIGPGQVFVDMSTVDPFSSAEVNAAIERRGAKFIRCTVSGSVDYALSGQLTIMASGDRQAYDRVFPLLEILGNRHYYLGPGEESRYMKIIVNMLLGTSIQAMAESLVMGEAVGIDWNQMIEVICDSTAANHMMIAKKGAYQGRDFKPMFTGMNMEKDMNLALDVAKERHLSVPLAAMARQMYAAMTSQGVEKQDYSAVLLVNESLNGI